MNHLRLFRHRLQSNLYSLRSLSAVTSTKDGEKKHWRKTFEERGEWTSKLQLFAPIERQEWGIMRIIQAPIDFRPEAIRRWWRRKKENREIFEQRFILERHQTLGNDLATAHFILYRGGKVKFCNESRWLIAKEHELPDRYTPEYLLEAVDAANVNIYYEGLLNFVGLSHLKWLSVRNCQHMNDWCLDYISGELQSLEYLDLCNCKNITENGLACLYRLQKLKFLNVVNIPQSKEFQLTCLLLEDLLPGLNIEGVDYIKL